MDVRHDDRIVVALRSAARDLAQHTSIRDLDQTLQQIVVSAVATIPGVDAGSISMTERDRIETRHPTSHEIGKLDGFQSELEEGPCITAILDPPEDGTVLARDFAGEDADRWPRFAPYAVEAGYRSLMSIQLDIHGGVRAALNLYSATPDAYDDNARALAGLFGVQAAMLLYGAHTAAHLQRAVYSRDMIGQAKGILRERFKVDDDGAFQMLVRSSQETNLKLTGVARWLVDNAGSSGVRDGADGQR